MYVKHIENVKSALIESVNSSQLYLTNMKLNCWFGYFEENTAVIITGAEYDYDSKTYLLNIRDLYHNNDKIRILAKDEEFNKAFRRCPETDSMYKDYREKVDKYYTENVQTYDTITVSIIFIVGLMVVSLLSIIANSLGLLVISKLVMSALWIAIATLAIILVCILTYKGYVRYIAKKGNWSGMIEKDQSMREQLAKDIEEYVKSVGQDGLNTSKK